MKQIFSKGAPEAIGPYSHAMVTGNLVYTSGQAAISPESNQLVGKDVKEQTEQVMKNIKAVLETAGSSMEKIVKTTCFLVDMADFAAFNEVYAKYITGKPARSTVAAKQLPKNALVEVEAIAELA